MFINKVLSYRNAWSIVNEFHTSELEDIISALPELIQGYMERGAPVRIVKAFHEIWDSVLMKKGWKPMNEKLLLENGQYGYLGSIGLVKNDVSAAISIGDLNGMTWWIFRQTPIAYRYGISKVPILLMPIEAYSKKLERETYTRSGFEQNREYLEPLAPMSHAFPFLLLGYSDEQTDNIEVMELESDNMVGPGKVTVDRCIEFPPAYYQAGLNILSFFGTYISEQYPNGKAKVKIEQDGNLVRLIVESGNGDREIIEKALHEYELFVSGKKDPEEITKNQMLAVEMRGELRMAKARIEMQQDLIQLKNRDIDKLSANVDRLMEMVGNALKNPHSVNIDFKPHISLNNAVQISNSNLPEILLDLATLKELFAASSPEALILNDLETGLAAIENEQDPQVVKGSKAMEKLKKMIDDIADKNTKLHKTIKAVESGWDTFRDLAGKYNGIAQWCGLPQIPKIFTK